MPLEDINYIATTSMFYFMNARGMQAARNPPKAKMKATPKDTIDYKRPRPKLPPQSPGCRLPCHPATLLLVPQKHAVSAMQ